MIPDRLPVGPQLSTSASSLSFQRGKDPLFEAISKSSQAMKGALAPDEKSPSLPLAVGSGSDGDDGRHELKPAPHKGATLGRIPLEVDTSEAYKQCLEALSDEDQVAPSPHTVEVQQAFINFVKKRLANLDTQAIASDANAKLIYVRDIVDISQELFLKIAKNQAEYRRLTKEDALKAATKNAELWDFFKRKHLEIQKIYHSLQNSQSKHTAKLQEQAQYVEMQKKEQEFNHKMTLLKFEAERKHQAWSYLKNLELQNKREDVNLQEMHPPTETVLHLVARAGDAEMIDKFLKAGSSKETHDEEGNTPFACAVLSGNVKAAELLRPEKLHNFRNQKKQTLLHLAAASGKLEMVQWIHPLCKSDINEIDEPGYTPLWYAVLGNHLGIAEWLHKNHGRLTARDHAGKTLLEASLAHSDEKITQWILSRAPDLINNYAEGCLAQVLLQGNIALANVMIANGTIFDSRKPAHQRLLHRSAAEGRIDVLAWLLAKDVPVDALDEDGCTPLLRAILGGQVEAVNCLIRAGAKTAAPIPGEFKFNGEKITPTTLTHASVFSKTPFELIEIYAKDIDAKDSNGMTPLEVSVKQGFLLVAQFLVNRGASVTAENLAKLAVHSGMLAMVQWVISLSGTSQINNACALALELEHPQIAGWLLQTYSIILDLVLLSKWAAKGQKMETLRLLLTQVDINHLNAGYLPPQTAFETACYHHNLEGGKLLLEQRCLIRNPSSLGKTLLHLIMETGIPPPELVRWVLSLPGCEIEKTNEAGLTPIQDAVQRGYYQTAAILDMEGKANTAVTTRDGETLIHLAVRSRSLDCLKYAYSKCKIQLEAVANQRTALSLSLCLATHSLTTFLLMQGARWHQVWHVFSWIGSDYVLHLLQVEDRQAFEKLFALGVSADSEMQFGFDRNTILFEAIILGKIEMAKFFVRRGASLEKALARGIASIICHEKKPLPNALATINWIYSEAASRSELQKKVCDFENGIHQALLNDLLPVAKFLYNLSLERGLKLSMQGAFPSAVRSGCLQAVQWIYEVSGRKIDSADCSVLHNQVEIARWCHGQRIPFSSEILHLWASNGGTGAMLDWLIDELTIALKGKDANGKMPIQRAILSRQAVTLGHLIQRGALKDLSILRQRKILRDVIESPDNCILYPQIAQGGLNNLDVSLPNGTTLLASYLKRRNAKAIVFLVVNQANPNVATEAGKTVLHDAAGYFELADLIRVYPYCKSQGSIKDRENNTPLDVGLAEGRLEQANYLISQGVLQTSTFDPKSPKYTRLLAEAAEMGLPELFKWLAERDVPMAAQGGTLKNNAIFYICLHNRLSSIPIKNFKQSLLDQVNLCLPNTYLSGCAVWHIGVWGALQIYKHKDYTPWFYRYRVPDLPVDTFVQYFKEGIYQDTLTALEFTVLMADDTTYDTAISIINRLIGLGAKKETLTSGKRNLIHLAVLSGSLKLVKWAYEQMPGELNSIDLNVQTPFDLAHESSEIALWLASKGAKTRLKTVDGDWALTTPP